MPNLSAKLGSTLRLFTRAGRELTFATTLVEDGFTRPLRSLVDDGFLTMEYTGTRRVYTLTDLGRTYLEGKAMARKKTRAADAARHAVDAPVKNGHAAAKPKRHSEPAARPEPAPRQKKPAAPPPAPPARRVAAAAPVSPVDVIRLMREVRDYAEAHEGVDALLAMVQRVEEIGQRFGGLDCVRESLQAIREFRGDK
jgi:hypothetical protein